MPNEERFPTTDSVSEILDRLHDYIEATNPTKYPLSLQVEETFASLAAVLQRSGVFLDCEIAGWLPGTGAALFILLKWIAAPHDALPLPEPDDYVTLLRIYQILRENTVFNLGQEYAETPAGDPRRSLRHFLGHLMTRRKPAPKAMAIVRALMDRDMIERSDLLDLGHWEGEGIAAIKQACKRLNEEAEEVALPWRFRYLNDHVVREKS